MGICQQPKGLKSKLCQVFTNPILDSSSFSNHSIDLKVRNEAVSLHYLVSCHGGKRNEVLEYVASQFTMLLTTNATSLISSTNNEEVFKYLNSILLALDTSKELKDSMIILNLILIMRKQVFNLGIGDMKSLAFAKSESGKLVITELIQPHLFIHPEETKRQTKYSSGPLPSLRSKKSAYSHKMSSNRENNNFFEKSNVSRFIGLSRTRNSHIISKPDTISISLLNEVFCLGIFSSTILKVMDSFELGFFISEHYKSANQANISELLIEKARKSWKRSSVNLLQEESLNRNTELLPKKIESFSIVPEFYCLIIFL